ncbi:wyosine [tRNA(Phe)-imidazoG37] synthetase (radical SAM superfamily) [Deinobacterium chartae]|uniref:Wyosine [tRNA(Phe)-imidazoG37] synthetase (Radical SAM superfamily) n=1 Tax=Deinobacterium chartae TaxID=521158 RepID=A0A841I6Z6_9DEIO|nr:radical SAM protein [Deinobacterium chartae]MBB6099999.1 wyosine [tRNA(Phe)-imidazoG37] synthetase (radical SAM superfamily) [Deinobacterium chartae]
MFLWSGTIYGPVRSRRLGLSLGVNLLPPGCKVCTYDCPYCECGFTRGGLKTEASQTLPEREEVLRDLEAILREEPVDAITFAGNGEPTLHPDLEEILAGTVRLRDALAPRARLVMLTNGIKLRDRQVRDRVLHYLDEVEVKLDAGTEETFAQVARPTVPFDLAELEALLVELGDRVVVQSCLFTGRTSNVSEADLSGIERILTRARPRRVELYSIDRAPADEALEPVSKAFLEAFAGRLRAQGLEAVTY